MSASAERTALLRDATLVAAVKVLVSAVVLASGFRALSDDDYARIVIAQRFATAPAFDPSGTSWLPFPFWTTGGAMLALGRSVEVARAVAFCLGLLATLLVWLSARWLGASRQGAVLAGVLGGAIPYAAWLGVATVPEGPAAALMLLGAAATTRAEVMPRALGAAALGVACLSRYEAWPAAAAFAAVCAWDALRARRPVYLLAALLAIAAPALWLVHGALAHGDALFFVARVAEYRRAVAASPVSLAGALFRYPLALLRSEPELVLLALLAVSAARFSVRRFARPAAVLAAVLVSLVAADLRDGAPTHHAERTLLALWLLLAVVAGEALASAWAMRNRPQRKRLALAALAAVLLGAIAVRPFFARRDSFIDRTAEVAVGRAAKRLPLGAGERLLVDTPDFGYFAVLAGYEQPDRAGPLDDRDPRGSRRHGLDAARYLVIPRAGPANLAGEIRIREGGFVVLELARLGPAALESTR